MKTYKVGIVPGVTTEVVIEDANTTIKELFSLAGLSLDEGYTIRRNGETVDANITVGEAVSGTSFYASKMIKGN